MKTLEGKYTNAVIYTDIIDDMMIRQVQTLIDQKFMKDVKVRIMPDCHAGAGCVIGTTIEIKDKIVPNLVGVDIGCGMLTVSLGTDEINLESLDEFIHNNIPSGKDINEEVILDFNLEELACYSDLRHPSYLKKSLCSLGGGNHFIEIDKNDKGEHFLIVHSGSRNLGKQVAEVYQDKAIEYHNNKIFNKTLEIRKMIDKYKQEGKAQLISAEMERIKNMVIEKEFPDSLAYLEGKDFDNYIHDMDICQKFAVLNRREMARKILNHIGLDFEQSEKFETIHNYINMKDKILRKGAISAYQDEIVLIPINMRDGCIIARGKSNPEYNYSAPHGAGRIMSRAEAMSKLSVDDFVKTMDGIYSTTVNKSTLDEAPFAYKSIESILENIKDTVEVLDIIKPIYNFKASE